MCRLLGWVGSRPRTVAEMLGDDGLASFTGLSREHADGWGMAWLAGDGTVHRVRGTDPAHRSQQWRAAARDVRSVAGLVHLRWATPGYPVREANSHPFLAEGAAFAHNGAIRPPEALDALLAERERASLSGDTDSERYFAVLRDRQRRLGRLDGWRATVRDLSGATSASSLNAMRLDDTGLTALCCHDTTAVPAHAEGAAGPTEGVEGYFDLRYTVSEEQVLVASSGWPQPGWQVLPEGSALRIRLGGPPRVVEIGKLAAGRGGAPDRATA